MLLEISSYSQFRIGICIAIIILLLGIVSIYTIKTMEEINQNSDYQIEYNQKISKSILKTFKQGINRDIWGIF